MTVLITTPIGLIQKSFLNMEDGFLEQTSVPASVALQIEEAIIQRLELRGVATYEDEVNGYKYEFPWHVEK